MKLFIDDIREPPDSSWIVARTVKEAIIAVGEQWPTVMSLDHDLGGDETVVQFLRYLTEEYYDRDVPNYVVHSANPVGRDNIVSIMESWKKSKERLTMPGHGAEDEDGDVYGYNYGYE